MCLVSIISVNFNQPQVTLEFLDSVSKLTSAHPIELILVDNGSSLDNGELFTLRYPGVKYIRSEKNLGFAGGNNLGILEATGEFILFVNNDTELTPDMIDILIDELNRNPEIGLISPLILYHDNKELVQYAGFTPMNYLTARNSSIGLRERDNNQYNISYETGFIHGAAMMCRKRDLELVGLMEENYFLYYEELDWCEKFRKAGKKIWFSGRAKIYHKESISVGKESPLKTYFMHRNRMLFVRKNTGSFNTLAFGLFYLFIVSPRTILKHFRNDRNDLIFSVMKAIIWNLTNSKNSKFLGYKTAGI